MAKFKPGNRVKYTAAAAGQADRICPGAGSGILAWRGTVKRSEDYGNIVLIAQKGVIHELRIPTRSLELAGDDDA